MTNAMRGRDALHRSKIKAEIVSVDPSLTKRGCSYGIAFPEGSEKDVVRILKQRNIDHGEILGAHYG